MVTDYRHSGSITGISNAHNSSNTPGESWYHTYEHTGVGESSFGREYRSTKGRSAAASVHPMKDLGKWRSPGKLCVLQQYKCNGRDIAEAHDQDEPQNSGWHGSLAMDNPRIENPEPDIRIQQRDLKPNV